MGETLSTINQLAIEAEQDPRTVELTLTPNGVRPVARLHGEWLLRSFSDTELAVQNAPKLTLHQRSDLVT